MKKELIGIIVCMLLLFPILSTPTIAYQELDLEINIYSCNRLLRRGLLYVEIINNGEDDVHNVNYTFIMRHPLIKFLEIPLHEESIDLIKAGDMHIDTYYLSWIGRIVITVTANVPDGEQLSKTVNGFVLFGFIIIFPE